MVSARITFKKHSSLYYLKITKSGEYFQEVKYLQYLYLNNFRGIDKDSLTRR